MGETRFIIQTGPPAKQTKKLQQKQINSHVAQFANGRRAKLTAISRSLSNDQCPLQRTPPNARAILHNSRSGSRKHEQHNESSSANDLGAQTGLELSSPRPSPAGSRMDQFACFAFPANSDTNRILHFWDWFIITPNADYPQLRSLRKDAWSLTTSAFTDRCRGYAFMSTAAHLHSLTTGDQSTAILANKFRGISMTNLNTRISRNGFNGDVAASILALISSELAHGATEAATLHIKYLNRHVQPEQGVGKFGPAGAKHIFLWQDIQRSTRTLTRPIVDIDRWQREECPGLWMPKGTAFRALLDKHSSLDADSLMGCRMFQLFTETKKYGTLLGVMTSAEAAISRDNSLRLSTSLLLLNGRLLELYLDQRDMYKALLPSASSTDVLAQYQAAAATLAAIYWLRVMTRDEAFIPICGYESDITMFNATPSIIAEMECLLRATEETARALLTQHVRLCCQNHNRNYSMPPSALRLRLWILHVGAHIERLGRRTNQAVRYHQAELGKLISALGLQVGNVAGSEPAVGPSYNAIISGFLPIDKNTTVGPMWFTPIFRTVALAHDKDHPAPPSLQEWETSCLLDLADKGTGEL